MYNLILNHPLPMNCVIAIITSCWMAKWFIDQVRRRPVQQCDTGNIADMQTIKIPLKRRMSNYRIMLGRIEVCYKSLVFVASYFTLVLVVLAFMNCAPARPQSYCASLLWCNAAGFLYLKVVEESRDFTLKVMSHIYVAMLCMCYGLVQILP